MVVNIKYCKKCKAPFDIGTNYDLCPYCRRKMVNKKEGRINGTRRLIP